MAYLVFADFRTVTLLDPCYGLSLSITEAPDSALTTAIARLTQRLNDWTNDSFESESLTLDLDVAYPSDRLAIHKRTTAVSSVSTRDEAGALTVQTSTTYRLHSSLYASGSKRQGELDHLTIVPESGGLTAVDHAYTWPIGPQTVRVIGTFGWTTTPGDIKRALAFMVYDHFKPQRGDLRRASRVSTPDTTTEYLPTDPELGTWTGIPEADAIIRDYRREAFVAVV